MGTFAATLCVDESGSVADSAVGQIFASTDLTATSPLTPTDLNGTPFPAGQIISSSLGVVPPFRVPGYVSVDWVSGAFRVPVVCVDQLPLGGTTGQTIQKVSNTDYDVQWVNPSSTGVPTGGTAGQVLTKNTSTNGDVDWITPAGGGGGGSAMLFYNGTSWPSRPVSSTPFMWVSTQHPAAAMPPMNVGDMWVRHPDAV